MSSEWLSVAEIFGEDVFNDAVMQERLPKKVYKKLKQTIEEGKELDLETADVIAHEMKEWQRIWRFIWMIWKRNCEMEARIHWYLVRYF